MVRPAVLAKRACGASFFLLPLLQSFCHLLKTLFKTLSNQMFVHQLMNTFNVQKDNEKAKQFAH